MLRRARPYALLLLLLLASIARAQQPVQDVDASGTGAGANKAAVTPPLTADIARVTVISPNNTGLPVNLAAPNSPTGGVSSASTTATTNLSAVQGDTLVGLCGVNNTGTLAISDSRAQTWTVARSQTGTVAGALVAFSVNVQAGATTITCTAGTSGVVAAVLYDVPGLLDQVPNQIDATDSNTGSSQTAASLNAGLTPTSSNEIAFAATMLTANNTGTAAGNWSFDTQQGAVGGNLIPARQAIGATDRVTGNVATFASSSYAMAVATFRVVTLGVAGSVAVSRSNTGLPGYLPVEVQKHAAASSGSVASLANAFGSSNTAGNSIVVVFCNGNNNQAAAPITDTNANTYTKTQSYTVNGTAFECNIFFAVNILPGANTVTVTPGGTNASIASEVYEVSGLISAVSAQPDSQIAIAGSTGTSTGPSSQNLVASSPNALAFFGVGVGTAAQTITFSATQNWTNDSGQQNPTTPAGLFSFGSASELRGSTDVFTASATLAGSEPWAISMAGFRSVVLGMEGRVHIWDGTTTVGVATGQNSLKTDITSVAGAAVSTAASGVQLVGIEGRAGTSLETTAGVLDHNLKNVNNSAVSTAATGVQKVGVVGNAGANFDAATAAAVPANALYVGGNGSGNLTGIIACDNSSVVNMVTATTTQIIAISGTAGRTYICSLNLIASAADNVALISGSGTNCASNVAALAGGTTAATGWNFGANGGISIGTGLGIIAKSATTNNEICLVTSSTAQLSGSITWTQF